MTSTFTYHCCIIILIHYFNSFVFVPALYARLPPGHDWTSALKDDLLRPVIKSLLSWLLLNCCGAQGRCQASTSGWSSRNTSFTTMEHYGWLQLTQWPQSLGAYSLVSPRKITHSKAVAVLSGKSISFVPALGRNLRRRFQPWNVFQPLRQSRFQPRNVFEPPR